jgi:exodeoxyribonuclease VII large subunit
LDKIYQISEITSIIKQMLEENLPPLWLEGEISNFKDHYSGHFYFTLKDETSQISAVMWRSRTMNIDFNPQDGMLVKVLGNIRVYEKSGRYQIDIIAMQEAGAGKLQLEFEKLKKKLDHEGLFDQENKRAMPKFAEKIGIITASTGAALQDILNVLERRAPHVEKIIRSAKVQGAGAAEEIAEAIKDLNTVENLDLIIMGRGGGSIEDLWAFNEETVARAIYDSAIPVISAVGHEIDFTIADFVADLRAPTPSAAAELAVPDYGEMVDYLHSVNERIRNHILEKMQRYEEKLKAVQNSYGFRRPEDIFHQYSQRLDELQQKIEKSFLRQINLRTDQLKHNEARLNALNPKNVIQRGYSITYDQKGKVIRTVKDINEGDLLLTEFGDGKTESRVESQS